MTGFDNDAPDDACRRLLDFLIAEERAWMRQTLDVPGAREAIFPQYRRDADPKVSDGALLREGWYGQLGNVLWDVFSDNNDVCGPGGERYHLGSWRGSGGFLADYLNARLALETDPADVGEYYGPFGYMDFYMGSAGLAVTDEMRSIVPPLYERVFERLRARDCDWEYAPPAIGMVRFQKPDPPDDPATYNPSEALAREAEQEEKDAEFDRISRELAESNARAFAEVERNPPPIVRAYERVYGCRPRYVRH